jgi:hypothetical protein
MRRVLLALLGVTLAAGLGFILFILANIGTGVELHEVAGSVLLVLLAVALWPAIQLRRVGRAPMIRVVVAIGSLVAAGLIGASLAEGAASNVLAGLPLVPLVVMLSAVADAIRVTRKLRDPDASTESIQSRSARL